MSSVLDLILNRGKIEADAARNSGELWSNTIGSLGNILGQGIQAYGQQRDQKQVQNAITAATTSQSVDPNNPNAGIESIVGGVSPQLRDKVRAGIGAITKAQQDAAQEQLNTKKMQAELEASNQKAQQGHLDAMAGFGKAVELHFGEKDNGINAAFQGLSMLGSAGNPVAQQYGKFVSDAKQHYDARVAAGDQQGADAVAQEFRAQSQPLIDGGWSRASPDFQKTWMDTQKVKADMAEPDKLIGVPEGGLANSRTGAIVVPGTPKPDTRSIDVRLAQAAASGDQATYQQLLKVKRDEAAAGRDPNTDVAVHLTGEALDTAARAYIKSGGNLPSMGMGRQAAAAKVAIINRASEMESGVDLAGNKAGYAADTGSLKKLQQQSDAVTAFENTANKNTAVLKETLKKLPDGGSSLLNRPIRALAGALGSEDIARFNVARQSVQNEYARIISNPNLSGVMSDSARKEAEHLLSDTATVGQILAALDTLGQEASNRRTSFDDQLKAIRGRTSGTAQTQAQAPTATGPNGQRLVLKNGQWVPLQ